jgi:hypothetical protein
LLYDGGSGNGLKAALPFIQGGNAGNYKAGLANGGLDVVLDCGAGVAKFHRHPLAGL